MKLYPLKFEPIYKQRIWGGQKLREIFGKDIPTFENIGESWELADLPEDKSVITNGEFTGETINAVINKYPEQIMADEEFSGAFPLLIKILDAEDILSVQVHPSPQTCKKIGAGDPKTECWYIIDAADGSYIYKGLKEGVTKEKFVKAIEKGTVEELLNKVEVSVGQCHFLPAGTPHAIGPGLLIAEIQTPSDTTYRVFDFNRVDDNGRPRQLHIKEALESINFEQDSAELTVTTIGRLVDCEHFTVDKGHQAAGCELLLSPGEVKVLIFIEGDGEIVTSRAESVEFKTADTMLIPAAYEGVVNFVDETKYLTVIPRGTNV